MLGARWRVLTCASHVLGCVWQVLARAKHVLARAVRGRSCRNCHLRVEAPVRPFFMPFFRSEDEEPYGGVRCSIQCSEGRVFETVETVARGGACNPR